MSPLLFSRCVLPRGALLIVGWFLLGVLLIRPGYAQGPGLGNLSYNSSELFTAVSTLSSPRGHGNAALVGGYLMTIYSSDGGGTSSNGGIDFWDVSDPRNPILFKQHDNADTHGMREAHGFAFSNSYAGNTMVVQGVEGIQFWDVTDPANIHLLNYMDLPGITVGDYSGDWWVFWQAPYVYVGGVDQGLYIVDASDPTNPTLIKRIPTNEMGGMAAAQVFVIGNLLLIARNALDGFASFDLSDPEAPRLLTTYFGNAGYSHLFAAGNLFTSGGNGSQPAMYVTQVSHDGQFQPIGSVSDSSLGNGGYGTYQDGIFHSGFSSTYAKFQVYDQSGQYNLQFLGAGSAKIPNADEDFGFVLGNLVFVGNDHGASGLIVHQIEPDLIGPDVHWVHPADGASDQALTSRIGVSMSDNIDINSVDVNTFTLRPAGGPPLSGKYSLQMGIVNFSPDNALLPNTRYELTINGITDLVGNSGSAFSSSFTTADSNIPTCQLDPGAPLMVGDSVSFQASATNSAAITDVSWRFGDDSPPETQTAIGAISHTYTAPGRYSVILTLNSALGSSSCSGVQIVYRPLSATAARHSSSIVQSADFVYSVNPDNDSVTAIDKQTLSVVWETAVGREPKGLIIGPEQNLWVVNKKSASVTLIDAQRGQVLGSISLPIGSEPQAIAVAPDNTSVYISLFGSGRLLKLNPRGDVIGNIDVGPAPRHIAISPDTNTLYVARFISPTIDPNDPAFLPTAQVREIDSVSFSVTKTITLAFDAGPDSELSGRGVPNYLGAMRISPDGSRLLVPSKKDNVARGLFHENTPLTFESRLRSIVSEIDIDAGMERPEQRLDFNDRSMPQAVLFSPLGDLVFTAMLGNNIVDVRDANDMSVRVTSLNVGHAPQGLVIDAERATLYVHNYLSRSVSVFDVADLLAGRDAIATHVRDITLVASEHLQPGVLRGKRIFYNASDPRMSKDGYISCAGCHLDGGQDGQVWDFTQAGEGLRNTIELNGRAGTSQGNVHWTANFDEIQDFENDIRFGFGGGGFLDDAAFATRQDPLGLAKAGISADLDALAAYVTSLNEYYISPYRNSDKSLKGLAGVGRALFVTKACTECHGGEDFTDGQRHDVGTAQVSSGLGIGAPLTDVGFRTPTLKGIWKTAPYLHNGQAGTLAEVLENNAHVGELSDTEKRALVDYLLQIDALEQAPTIADLAPVDPGTANEQVTHIGEQGAGAIVMELLGLILLSALLRLAHTAKSNTVRQRV